MNRRPLHFISRERELVLIQQLQTIVDVRGCTPDNTAVVMVSPDYSATVAMHLAHDWSMNGEVFDILTLNVPYPDESPLSYITELEIKIHEYQKYDRLILVEAGIIRGGNWQWILNTLTTSFGIDRNQITTVALCENINSKVKSDYVAEYYDDDKYELMFYFERYNQHWPIK
jgi:hypothetical protein